MPTASRLATVLVRPDCYVGAIVSSGELAALCRYPGRCRYRRITRPRLWGESEKEKNAGVKPRSLCLPKT